MSDIDIAIGMLSAIGLKQVFNERVDEGTFCFRFNGDCKEYRMNPVTGYIRRVCSGRGMPAGLNPRVPKRRMRSGMNRFILISDPIRQADIIIRSIERSRKLGNPAIGCAGEGCPLRKCRLWKRD